MLGLQNLKNFDSDQNLKILTCLEMKTARVISDIINFIYSKDILIASQKLLEQVKKELEEIRKERAFYFKRFGKTKAKADKIRYAFLYMEYYKMLYKENNNCKIKILYKRAKENYEKLFPCKDVFSSNRKP